MCSGMMTVIIADSSDAGGQPDAAQDAAGVLVRLIFSRFSAICSLKDAIAPCSPGCCISTRTDHFGILLATAQTDVAGAVTVKPL